MNPTGTQCAAEVYTVHIPPIGLAGTLRIPAGAAALVVFAHGSGSSRLSPRNMVVAEGLNEQGMATLLFDLLTLEEEVDRANVFDIPLLAERVIDAVDWIGREPLTQNLRLGLFGRVRERQQHSSRRRGSVIKSERLSLAADALTLPVMSSIKYTRRRF